MARRTALLLFLLLVFTGLLNAQPYDFVLAGGWVIDGTGNPEFRADVGIRNGVIVRIGNLEDAAATERIDATGRHILPGFIDLHSHADDPARQSGGLRSADRQRRVAPNLVSQGITTVVVNQDGRSPWPISEQLQSLQELGFGPNAVLLIGHGTVRSQVLGGDFRREATSEEIERMRRLVHQGMYEGARGISAGLEYPPGRWSTTREMIALVEQLVAFDGVYISHQRSEGSDPMWFLPSRDTTAPTLLDSVRETIEIGEATGATVVASHIKAKGAHYWGSSLAAIQLIESARKRGVRVWADQYPYDTTGSDGRTVLIPSWVRMGRSGSWADAIRETLDDPESSARLFADIEHEMRRRGGADRVIVFEHAQTGYIGKSVAAISRQLGLTPSETAIRLQLEGDHNQRGGGRLRGFSLAEIDIDQYARQPWTATASDAGVSLADDGPVHARFYGTFPRKIRRYALDRQVVSLYDAVRSMTSLPAQILGLRDRGLLREGFHADVVIVDLEQLHDRATFTEPHQPASGIELVLINGVKVVENSKVTGALPGKVLTGKEEAESPSS